MKKWLAICVCLVIVTDVLGQSRSKRAKQPREVMQAYQVCTDFQHLLAEDLNFDRAFEATFVKDSARRRAIAIAETEFTDEDLAQFDDATAVALYKDASQILLLVLPMMFAGSDEKSELFPPPIDAIFERKPPKDPQKIPEFASQLKRDVASLRTHFEKVVAQNPAVAENVRQYKKYLLKPLEPPNRVIKPMTGYSKGRVLRTDEKYYQIDDCAVISEGGQMKLIGYVFLRMRF